jgi:hypothetical protein
MKYHDKLQVVEVFEMTEIARQKFATQVDVELLTAVRELAQAEGRQIQAVVEEALREHLEARRGGLGARQCVVEAYLKSTERYAGLYKKLAE